MLAIFCGFPLILMGYRPVGKGLILGAIFSVINFVLMAEIIPLQIGKTKKKTFLIAFGSIIFRYFILAIPIVVSVKFDQFNFFSSVLGIFTVQILILTDHFLSTFLQPEKNTFREKL